MNTPWGNADSTKIIADGIVSVCTPSHGGFMLSQERRDAMPEQYRIIPTFAGGNAYEEDCDWSLVALSFPQYFDARTIAAATSTYQWMVAEVDRVRQTVINA